MHPFLRVVAAALVAAVAPPARPALAQDTPPRNVILIVGDGMGIEAVKLGRAFENGDTAPLSFEDPAKFPHRATMTHHNAQGGITDSAASATAMATGVKVNNGVLSKRLPGDGEPLTTAADLFRQQGKAIGIVTRTTDLLDATPSAWNGHVEKRDQREVIFRQVVTRAQPDLIFGGTHAAVDAQLARDHGYTVVSNDAATILDVVTSGRPVTRILAHWKDQPPLRVQAAAALRVLERDPEGFFLLLEEENTDEAGHGNNAGRMKDGVLSLRDAVDAVLQWADGRDDTLIIVTADHETGGLTVAPGPYTAGALPEVTWSTKDHSATPVGAWARGPGSDRVTGAIDNTDIFYILTSQQRPPQPEPTPVAEPASAP